MTPWTRDLNLCSAILDMALWALLIASRDKDYCLLLLSGGLGIRFTGEAIGTSLRQLALSTRSRPLSLSGGVLMVLANLVFLYVWWQAFRRRPSGRRGEGSRSPAIDRNAPLLLFELLGPVRLTTVMGAALDHSRGRLTRTAGRRGRRRRGSTSRESDGSGTTCAPARIGNRRRPRAPRPPSLRPPGGSH